MNLATKSLNGYGTIPEHWEAAPLPDVVFLQEGPGLRKWQWTESGMKVINVTNILGDGSVDTTNTSRFISTAEYEKTYRHFTVDAGDIVVASSGNTYGKVGRISPKDLPLMMNTSVIRFHTSDPKRLNGDFLYAFLRSEAFRNQIESFVIGSAQPNFGPTHLKRMVMPLPPLHIQRFIAGILSSYDDLIENSRRRITILESMARTLYREALSTGAKPAASHLIVDSTFWRFISENVSKYAGTKRYYATADIDGLAITGSGIDYSFAQKPSRAQKIPIPNSVWFARMKETYKIAWYGPHNDERVSGVMLSSGFAGFEANDAELWPLLFLTISSNEFHAQKDLYCTGATQMSLTNEGLARIRLPLPDEQCARRLGRTAGPILTAIAGLQRRNEILKRTRDLLLPRLLSGQIDVEAIAP